MTVKFAITPRLLSDPFWNAVLSHVEGRSAARARLAERLNGLDALRAQADYNTGSISLTAGWCLYALVQRFQLRRVIEVGTFIGKSTLSMAAAMDDEDAAGEIFTCDGSNAIDLPWDGRTRVRQFKATTSTAMLQQLDGACDFAFLDGRVTGQDLPLLEELLAADALIGLDDFEGMEKGVANLSALSGLPRFRSHVLVYPPSPQVLQRHGLAGYSLTAILLPLARLQFSRQG